MDGLKSRHGIGICSFIKSSNKCNIILIDNHYHLYYTFHAEWLMTPLIGYSAILSLISKYLSLRYFARILVRIYLHLFFFLLLVHASFPL